MAGQMAKWANDEKNSPLWQAKPVKGDIGILVVPESQIRCYVSENSTEFYYRSITGAYQGFLFNNIQADFVYAKDIGPEYDVLYLPYPVMLPASTAEALKDWVVSGGCLISEGCPAYFGDRGRAGTRQPNYGLDELFGVTQQDIQLTPDLLDELRITMNDGLKIRGGVFLQSYIPTAGKVCGTYSDGRIAAVDNIFGKGRTKLIGTFPGYGYAKSQDEDTKQFFAELLSWTGKVQHVTSSDWRIIARLHTGQDATFLWVVNSAREDVQADLTLSELWGAFRDIKPYWGEKQNLHDGRGISVSIPARDALVMKLV
jgi:beta-galactosidase